jgi:hypothetical protein
MTCLNNTSVAGCYASATGNIGVVIHYTFDNAGAPKVIIADVGGAVVAGATLANTTAGACAVASPDVEWLTMCDTLPSGAIVRFEQRTITSWNAANVPASTTAFFAADRTTVYVPAGTVAVCENCQPLTTAQRGVQTAW